MFRRTWPQKPPSGTQLDAGNPLVAGLAGAWILNEGTGPPNTHGAAKGLATANSMTWAPAPVRGIALYGSGANNPVQFTVADGSPLDITGTAISYGGWIYPTVSNQNHWILGRSAGASGNTIQYGVALSKNGTGQLLIQMRAGASGYSAHTVISTPWLVNAWNLVIVTYDGAAIRGYLNGKLVCSVAQTGSIIRVSGANLCLGSNGNGFGYVTGIDGYLDAAFAWSRVLSAPEVEALYERPYEMWRTRVTEMAAVDLVPAIYSVTPSPIPSGHSSSITLSVHGYRLGWTPGSPGSPGLSISGLAGMTKVSQTITDANNATLSVNTGLGNGTATVSDGTYSTTFQVIQPTLAISPAVMAATGTYGVTLTGHATLWPTGSQPGLFTISGVGGATISNIQVQSATQATATIVLGSSTSAGTLTVTDTSSTVAATVAVEAVYGGMLHCSGQCLLQHSGGTTGLFSNRSAASLSFFLKISSNAGLNLSTGTTILKWASGSGSVTYYPATQLLTLAFYGQSGNFASSVPVQFGVGYHFALSWTNGSQVLYMNGLPYATASLATNTATVSGIQVGSNAGPGIATDHTISDLTIWGSYALTANDAAALAGKTSTPIQLGTLPSLWFSLGGGSLGATPSLSDPWFSDSSGNGNSLSLTAGSFANAAYANAPAYDSPITIAAQVVKSGKLALFGTMYAVPATNGAFPAGVVATVNAAPTIYRNGNAVSLGPATWPSTTLDTPFVTYLLRCGSVENIAIVNGGAGYTGTPTVMIDNTGTGGSGLTLGTPVVASGVTGYTITGGGTGYSQPPTVNFSGGGGSGATGYAVVYNGQVADVVVTSAGSGYTTPPSVTFTGGSSGSGALATATINGGRVTGATVTNGGSGYSNGPTVTVADPPGASGPQGNVPVCFTVSGKQYRGPVAVVGDANYSTPGAVRAIVPLVGGLLGCGSGYASAPVATIAAPPSGTTATATAIVSRYVCSIPVTSGGDGYNSPPTVTLSGGGASTQATVMPIMSGPAAADVMTYDAPANWLTVQPYGTTNSLGVIQAAVDASMVNWTGRLEGNTGGMACFAQQPTMLAGINLGTQPIVPSAATFLAKNMLHQGWWWVVDSGTGLITYSADGSTPASWTNPSSTILHYSFYNPNATNYVDATGLPAYAGPFALRYDDPNVNTAAANAVWIDSLLYSSNFTVTPIPLTGDSSAVAIPPGNITVSGGVVTAVSLSGVTFGSALGAYQGAVITCAGGGGSGFAANVVVSGGIPTAVNIICGGTGFTATPTMTIAGTSVSGTTITAIWNFTRIANPTAWSPSLGLYCANSTGAWTMSNPWVVAPNADGTINRNIDRTRQFAVDDNVVSHLTQGGKSVGLMRLDDRTQSSSPGPINLAFPTDLGPTPTGVPWMSLVNQRVTGATFQYARFINTDPAKGPLPKGDGTYNWPPTVKCYSHQAYATQLDSSFSASCTLTNGSPVVSTTSLPGLMAGASVSGIGIPTGSYVAYLGMQVFGSTVLGSPIVTGVPSTANIQVGMPVYGISGAGAIPVGVTVSAIGTNTITLSASATGNGPISLNVGANALFTLGLPSGVLANATVSGPESLTFQNLGYVPLPTSDNGFFVSNSFGSQYYVVLELVSSQPHGFRTGDTIKLYGDVTIPFTNLTKTGTDHRGGWQVTGTLTSGSPVVTGLTNANLYQPGSTVTGAGIPAGTTITSVQSSSTFTLSQGATVSGPTTLLISAWSPGAGAATLAYVTGPNSVACYANVGSGNNAVTAQPNGPQYVNSSTPISLASTAYPNGWIGTLAVPPGNANEPYEFGAAMAKQLGNTALWVNFSVNAGDALVELIARKIAAQLGAANDVYLQLANETWNNGYISTPYLVSTSTLISYNTSGTVMGYAPAPMPTQTSQFPADAILAAHAQDVFTAAFASAGGSADRVHRLLNGWWGGPGNGLAVNSNRAELCNAMEWGTNPSHLIVAPYLDTPTDWPLVTAYSPAGSPIGGAAFWPIDAINDFFRFWAAYSQANWGIWQTYGQFCNLYGQPLAAASVTASGAGGSIPAGTYYVYYTFIDGSSHESTVGLSQSNALTVGSGNSVNLTMPIWPSWAQYMRVYLSAPGAAAGALPASYYQVPRSQYGYGAIPAGATYTIASFPNAGSPPSTNLAAANAPTLPTIVCYEGGIERLIPTSVPLYAISIHDAMAHPSGRDAVWGWYMAIQQGCPTASGAAPVAANYYQYTDTYESPPSFWRLAGGACQPPGAGLSNSYATIQGGQPADGHDHAEYNQAAYLQGLIDFFSVSSPSAAPPTPVPRTRRWFANLARPVVRLGR